MRLSGNYREGIDIDDDVVNRRSTRDQFVKHGKQHSSPGIDDIGAWLEQLIAESTSEIGTRT